MLACSSDRIMVGRPNGAKICSLSARIIFAEVADGMGMHTVKLEKSSTQTKICVLPCVDVGVSVTISIDQDCLGAFMSGNDATTCCVTCELYNWQR